MTDSFQTELLAKLERIALSQETTALMLQVLMEDASLAQPESEKNVVMTQHGPVAY